MPSEKIQESLVKAIADVEEKPVLQLVGEAINRGLEPISILEACREGLEIVGERYERREYFLSALVMSGEIFREVVDMLEEKDLFPVSEENKASKIVLGAPLGDVHDLGKYIVSVLLRGAGFNVIDIGVSAKPSRFVEAVEEHGASLVGISTLITTAYESLRETVAAFEQAGLRDRVRIMLGGGAINQRVCAYAGADVWSREATDAVRFAKRFLTDTR